MPLDVTKYLNETDQLLDALKMRVAYLREPGISGFEGVAHLSFIHDFLKRAQVNADKLGNHFRIIHTREVVEHHKAGRK